LISQQCSPANDQPLFASLTARCGQLYIPYALFNPMTFILIKNRFIKNENLVFDV